MEEEELQSARGRRRRGSVVDAAARVTAGMAPPVDVIPASASLVLPSPLASSPAAVHGVLSSSETTTSSSYMEKAEEEEEEVVVEERTEEEVVGELVSMLEQQRKLVHLQIEELQHIVTLQCGLTGVNPLHQAMATALGNNGGKRLGGALSPEALSCLRAVFAVKDTITKKEARDICALSGATLTQVREYFVTQRSHLRNLVQKCSDVGERNLVTNAEVQLQQPPSTATAESNIGFTKLTDGESVDMLLELMRSERTFKGQGQLLQVILQTEPGLILRRFLEKGGLKIVYRWLIQASSDNQSSLLQILLEVLSHLPMTHAIPPQMSALLQPVNKLRFYHLSDVATFARGLMSKWSKLLMSKADARRTAGSVAPVTAPKDLSESSPGLRIRQRDAAVVVTGYDHQKKKTKIGLTAEVAQSKNRISPAAEKMTVDEKASTERGSLQKALDVPSSSNGLPASPVPLARSSGTFQVSESASSAVPISRKRSLADQAKERRTVLPVEDMGGGSRWRDINGRRPVVSRDKMSRPLSADEIRRAKQRARLLQAPTSGVGVDKSLVTQEPAQGRGKPTQVGDGWSLDRFTSSEIGERVPSGHIGDAESLDMPSSMQSGQSKIQGVKEEQNLIIPDSQTADATSGIVDGKQATFLAWTVPPEMKVKTSWGLAAGEESKEMEAQTLRVKREEEAIYPNLTSIPADPKDVWEEEPSYDDSLTPVIPTEIAPATEIEHIEPCSNTVNIKDENIKVENTEYNNSDNNSSLPTASTVGMESVSKDAPAPSQEENSHDPQLLKLLLSNPGLISQLTSLQTNSSNDGSVSALLEFVKEKTINGQMPRSDHIAPSKFGVQDHTLTSPHLGAEAVSPILDQHSDRMKCQEPLPALGSCQVGQQSERPVLMESNGGQPISLATKPVVVDAMPKWNSPGWTPGVPSGTPILTQGNNPAEHLSSVQQHTTAVNWPESATSSKWPGGSGWPQQANTHHHAQAVSEQFTTPYGRGRQPPLILTPNELSVSTASGIPPVLNVTNVALGGASSHSGQMMMTHSGVWPTGLSHASTPASNHVGVLHNLTQTANQRVLPNHRLNVSWSHTAEMSQIRHQVPQEFQEINGRLLRAENHPPPPPPPPPPPLPLPLPLPPAAAVWATSRASQSFPGHLPPPLLFNTPHSQWSDPTSSRPVLPPTYVNRPPPSGQDSRPPYHHHHQPIWQPIVRHPGSNW